MGRLHNGFYLRNLPLYSSFQHNFRYVENLPARCQPGRSKLDQSTLHQLRPRHLYHFQFLSDHAANEVLSWH